MSEKIRNKIAVFKAKGRWFRVYTEIVNDPKVQKLAPHLFKTWINLLALAAENDGKLPAIDDIAFKLRMSPKDAEGNVCELIEVGLIDIAPDRSLTPHNWHTRQYRWDGNDPTNAQRQKRHRNRRRNGRVTDEVTVPASVSSSGTTYVDIDQSLSIQGSEDGSCSEEGRIEHNAGRADGRYRNNTSGFPGVSRHKKSGRWQALIGYGGRNYHVGLFDTPEEAHEAYLSVCDDPLSLSAIAADHGEGIA